MRLLRRKTECTHEDVVSAIAAGIERTVCKDCGNVSIGFEMAAIASDELNRGYFSRDADQDPVRRGLTPT